jgi:tetratricopeptide (TPR) repeat protein
MVALLAVYFAQNIWVFDMVSSYMMFFLTLAFIYFLIQDRNQESRPPQEPKLERLPQAIGGLLIIVAVFTIYFGNIKPALASHYTVMGIVHPVEKAVSYFQKAFASSPMAQIETSEQISRKVTDLTYEENIDSELLRQGFALAEKELKESIAQNPQDFRLYLFLGRQYDSFYRLTKSDETLRQAEEILKKAEELSPKNQQVYWSMAQTNLYQGNEEGAVSNMQKAVDLAPAFAQSHWFLSMTYKAIGDDESAFEEALQAEKDGYKWRDNLEEVKKVIEMCQNLRNDKELVSLYTLAIEMDPKDARFKAGLAVAYANLGQFDKARQYAQEAIALNPDFKAELEEFLRQLPQ